MREIRREEFDEHKPTEFIHHNFRDQSLEIPVLETDKQFEAIIANRVKGGLDELYEEVGDKTQIQYAGYSLSRYLYPQEQLGFQHPKEAQQLIQDFTSMDMLPHNPPPAQDFYVELVTALMYKRSPDRILSNGDKPLGVKVILKK